MTDSHGTPIRVDHVGIAVESIADAEPLLELLGCEKLVDEPGKTGTFRWAYYALGDASRLELIEPTTEDSFLRAFLDEHGPGLHHVTLEVAAIDAVIDALEANDVRVVDRVEYETWIEAFVSPRNSTGTLLQLMEYKDGYETISDADEVYVHGERLQTD